MKNRLKNKFIYAFITLIMMMFTVASGNAYATRLNQAAVYGGYSGGTVGGYYSCWYQFCANHGTGFGPAGGGGPLLAASPDMAFIFSTMKGVTYFDASELLQNPNVPSDSVSDFYLDWTKPGDCTMYQYLTWANSEGTPWGTTNDINFNDVFSGNNSGASNASAKVTNFLNTVQPSVPNGGGYTYENSYLVEVNPDNAEGIDVSYDGETNSKIITIKGIFLGEKPRNRYKWS